MQINHPNPSKWSTDGKYSSKFVTCVISGNSNKEIDITSYQVSASAEAMIKADLIEPSINPAVMRVKEPTNERYVPDVFTQNSMSISVLFKKMQSQHSLLNIFLLL